MKKFLKSMVLIVLVLFAAACASDKKPVVMTMMFLLIILGATDKRAPQGFAPAAIGLGLTLIHLISIPVTNTSVNPARSTGVAVFVGDWAIAQLWLFWIAPIIGALLGRLFIVSSAERTYDLVSNQGNTLSKLYFRAKGSLS